MILTIDPNFQRPSISVSFCGGSTGELVEIPVGMPCRFLRWLKPVIDRRKPTSVGDFKSGLLFSVGEVKTNRFETDIVTLISSINIDLGLFLYGNLWKLQGNVNWHSKKEQPKQIHDLERIDGATPDVLVYHGPEI